MCGSQSEFLHILRCPVIGPGVHILTWVAGYWYSCLDIGPYTLIAVFAQISSGPMDLIFFVNLLSCAL